MQDEKSGEGKAGESGGARDALAYLALWWHHGEVLGKGVTWSHCLCGSSFWLREEEIRKKKMEGGRSGDHLESCSKSVDERYDDKNEGSSYKCRR